MNYYYIWSIRLYYYIGQVDQWVWPRTTFYLQTSKVRLRKAISRTFSVFLIVIILLGCGYKQEQAAYHTNKQFFVMSSAGDEPEGYCYLFLIACQFCNPCHIVGNNELIRPRMNGWSVETSNDHQQPRQLKLSIKMTNVRPLLRQNNIFCCFLNICTHNKYHKRGEN